MSKRIAGSNERIGLDETVFSNFPDYVPEEIKFGEVKKALAAKRTPIIIRAEQQQYSTDKNRKIIIRLPNQNILDMRKGFLKFQLAIAKTGGTFARLHSMVTCIFNRTNIINNTTSIEDLKDVNRILSLLWEAKNNPDMSGTLGIQCGFGTQIERNAAGATTTTYACFIPSALLNAEFLPTKDITSPIEIHLYLDEPTTFVETDGTNPIVTVSNVELHIEKYELEQSYTNKITDYIRRYGLRLGYHSWERQQNLVTTSVSQNIIINHRSASINGMVNIFVNSATLNDPTVNDKFITWLPQNLATTHLDVNSKLFPDEPIDDVSAGRWDPYHVYLRWANRWKSNGFSDFTPPINSSAWQVDRFLQIDDLEPYPEAPETIINPFTTLQNSANIRKKLTFTAPPAANLQLDTWIEFFVEVVIQSDGTVIVNQ